ASSFCCVPPAITASGCRRAVPNKVCSRRGDRSRADNVIPMRRMSRSLPRCLVVMVEAGGGYARHMPVGRYHLTGRLGGLGYSVYLGGQQLVHAMHKSCRPTGLVLNKAR